MLKYAIGLAALVAASASQAAVPVQINLYSGPSGSLGTSQPYSSGGYSVTAYGYSNFNFGTNSGTAGNLFNKNFGGDENGVGLSSDKSGQNEIWYANDNFQTIPTVILDVSSLLSTTTLPQFLMGSTTSNEQWILAGYKSGTGWTTNILNGMSEGSWVNLPSWGTYSKYAFYSGGTVTLNNGQVTSRTTGNVLLSALSVTPSVPEPATWMMMLLGFGGIGLAVRRKRPATLAQLA